MPHRSFFDSRIWKLLCSLKLAIVLACLTTVVTIGGSLLLPFNPQVFGELDRMPLGHWISQVAGRSPALTWWIPVGGVLVGLLGLNTFCCFVDWAVHIRARWRKCGEYLIHFGFIMILAAYLWGSHAGFRSDRNALLVGQTIPVVELGVDLTLEAFEPVLDERGRPVDMRNTLVLSREGQVIKRIVARVNHPLTWKGLVVLPASYGQTVVRGRPATYSVLTINHDPGAPSAFAGSLIMAVGVLLALVSFYRKRARGDRPEVV